MGNGIAAGKLVDSSGPLRDPTQQEQALDNCEGREQRWGWEIRWRHLVQQAKMPLAGDPTQRSRGLRKARPALILRSEYGIHQTRARNALTATGNEARSKSQYLAMSWGCLQGGSITCDPGQSSPEHPAHCTQAWPKFCVAPLLAQACIILNSSESRAFPMMQRP